MKTLMKAFILLVLCSFGFYACGDSNSIRGAASVVKSQPLQVSEAIRPANFGRAVRLQGAVKAVCSDDNCWIVLSDLANMMRIEFEDNRIAPSASIEGKSIVLEGKIIEKIISPTSSGYEEYEKSCGLSLGSATSGDQRVPVFVAYRVEIP